VQCLKCERVCSAVVFNLVYVLQFNDFEVVLNSGVVFGKKAKDFINYLEVCFF